MGIHCSGAGGADPHVMLQCFLSFLHLAQRQKGSGVRLKLFPRARGVLKCHGDSEVPLQVALQQPQEQAQALLLVFLPHYINF